MIQTNHLTQTKRDEITQTLNEKQKNFIDEYLKRGRRTIFANILAKEKASSATEEDMEVVADQWELLDYIDAGPTWKNNSKYFCECGRALRYQYIVENKETGELKKFGITHFEEHVGIPPHLVKEIVKGIESIDYERDEILLKIADNWTLADEQLERIPSDIEVPNDIQKHLDYQVPLLERQIRRLRGIVSQYYMEKERQELEYYREKERQRLEKVRQQEEVEKQRRQQEMAKRREELGNKRKWDTSLELDPSLQLGVIIYLQDLESTYLWASEVCKDLVAHHGASSETYSSGTLKIFPDVCNFLEHLTEQGLLAFMGKQNGIDRVYELLGDI